VTGFESPDPPRAETLGDESVIATVWPPPLPPPLPPPPSSQPAPLTTPVPLRPESLPILVALPERARQRRWTVLLRVFLALPLAVVVIAVGIAALVCAVIGWFVALVTGRVPAFVRTAVMVFLRMTVRLEAYLFLLTDRFPPFSADDVPGYPTGIALPPATRLNRAAVLFRLVLMVPATIALRIVGIGLYLLGFFMWVVVVITGWLPEPAHGAYRAYVRYETRFVGYLALLVPTYPGRLFGDEPTPPLLGAPVECVSGRDTSAQSPPPRDWNLVLGAGAKRFLVVAIILGAAAAITIQVLSIREQNHENLVQVNNQLVSSLTTFTATAHQCGNVTCLEHADGVLSQQLGSFVSAVESSDHAGVSQDLVDQVTTAARHAQQVTDALANAGPTVSDYQGVVARAHAAQSLGTLVSAQNQFANAVNGS
jgi:uncharacterized protein DUF4389